MEIVDTAIQGFFLIKNALFKDDRGYFFESFNHEKFSKLTGWKGAFIQDNQSESSYGVVRGLHFQEGEFAQAKLVRVLQGNIIDVVVDIRPESPSFGKVLTIPLDDKNEYQLFIPRGCAHGFSVLSPKVVFFYKCDNYYQKQAESGFNPLDETLNIDWKIENGDILLSEKDKNAISWLDYKQKIGR